MPTYDYRCEANGRVVEVKHGMNERIGNWGELCERARMEPGDTPPQTPVTRLITGGSIIGDTHEREPLPSCSGGTCGTLLPASASRRSFARPRRISRGERPRFARSPRASPV